MENIFPDKYPFVPRHYDVGRPALSAYIHIPFCRRKCAYCDFASYAPHKAKAMGMNEDEYTRYLCSEIENEFLEQDRKLVLPLETIYFGGGTPSVMSNSNLDRIIDTLNGTFGISKDAEITIEMNPENVTYDYIRCLRKSGFNRLSLGLQAAQEERLRFLGRLHSKEDFCIQVERARQLGFDNISGDIILALPNQTKDELEETLSLLCEYEVDHVSAYSLIIEAGTAFFNLYKKGRLDLPSDDEERDLVHFCEQFLAEHSYFQYEISNFCKPGKVSRHNSAYWLNEYYYGFGLGASSYTFATRRKRCLDFREYKKEIDAKLAAKVEDVLDFPDEAIKEYFAFSPRLIRPFSGKDYLSRFSTQLSDERQATLDSLVSKGLLRNLGDGSYILSNLGKDYADEVSRELFF